MAKDEKPQKLVAENRRARHDYFIEDDLEAGIVLEGSEVKSLRTGKANIAESYAAVEGGELWLINGYIPAYAQAKAFGHDERRRRKLLVNRRELAKLWQGTAREGMTLVPLRLYFNDRGKAKLPARHRQGQEARRQARHRGQARLAAPEGAADARAGLARGRARRLSIARPGERRPRGAARAPARPALGGRPPLRPPPAEAGLRPLRRDSPRLLAGPLVLPDRVSASMNTSRGREPSGAGWAGGRPRRAGRGRACGPARLRSGRISHARRGAPGRGARRGPPDRGRSPGAMARGSASSRPPRRDRARGRGRRAGRRAGGAAWPPRRARRGRRGRRTSAPAAMIASALTMPTRVGQRDCRGREGEGEADERRQHAAADQRAAERRAAPDVAQARLARHGRASRRGAPRSAPEHHAEQEAEQRGEPERGERAAAGGGGELVLERAQLGRARRRAPASPLA